jgi:hypothetical protein
MVRELKDKPLTQLSAYAESVVQEFLSLRRTGNIVGGNHLGYQLPKQMV